MHRLSPAGRRVLSGLLRARVCPSPNHEVAAFLDKFIRSCADTAVTKSKVLFGCTFGVRLHKKNVSVVQSS